MALVAGNGRLDAHAASMARTRHPCIIWMAAYHVMDFPPFGRVGRGAGTGAAVLLMTAHAEIPHLPVVIVAGGKRRQRIRQGGGYGTHQVAAVDLPPEQGDIG